jgi:hypothetical protein
MENLIVVPLQRGTQTGVYNGNMKSHGEIYLLGINCCSSARTVRTSSMVAGMTAR